MKSLEELSKQCVAVCEVPITANKDSIFCQVQRNLHDGRIIDSDKVDGIESDKNLTRLILLLAAVEDVKHLCEEVRQEEITLDRGQSFIAKYQRAVACELPERWQSAEIQEKLLNQSTSSTQNRQAPTPARRSDKTKPLERGPNQIPAGPYGPVSGFYENIPTDAPDYGGLEQEGGGPYLGQGQIPQPVQMQGHPYNQGNESGRGEDNKAFSGPPGFEGQRHLSNQQVQNLQYGQFPHRFQGMWRIPGNVPQNPQNIPFHPGMMGRPMIYDPQSGQLYPMPGIPVSQPTEGGRGPSERQQPQQQPQWPTGPPPPYNSRELLNQDQDQAWQRQAVYEQAAKLQMLKEKETHAKQEDQHTYESVNEEEEDNMGGQQKSETSEKPTKIVVSNLPSTAHEEFLEMFFENTRKFGGGPVFSVDYDEESASAIIEFEEPEAIDIVLNKCPIRMMGQVVEVDIYVPEEPVPLCTIEVRGPYSVVCEEQLDTLEMYFESKRRSGGEEVVECRFDDENNIVLITFQSEEVAQRVVERGRHVVMKKKLDVKLHTPSTESKHLKKVDHDKEENSPEPVITNEEDSPEPVRTKKGDSPEPVRTIKAKGIDKTSSRDTTEFYFENARRSGGGEIEKIESDEEQEDVLYITYKNPEVAEEVSKRKHKVEGKEIIVSLFVPPKPPQCYGNRVLIKGLKTSTTKDCLFNFIEAKSKFTPVSMDYHEEQEDVVMVTFEKDIDFDILKDVFGKFKLEEVSLKVSPIAVSNCIIVANLPDDVTNDTVTFYFENGRKSGGGEVDKVIMNDDDTCLVYFVDYTVIDRVLNKKHHLSGQKLDVKLYQESLGKPEGATAERKLHVPDPIVLKDVDPVIVKFMSNSKVNREALDMQLNDCYTSIEWPKDQGDVLLKCTLTASTNNCFRLAKRWKEDALKNFNDFMRNIIAGKVPVLQDIWTRVMEELKTVDISNLEAVTIITDQKEGLVKVVGIKKVAENITQTVEDITKKVMTEVEKEREKIKENVTNLKNIETRMLLAEKFPNKMEEQFSDLKVKINQNKNEILFEGPLGQVRDAKLKMYEAKSSFVNMTTEKLPALSTGLYSVKQTKDYIVKKLKAKGLTAVWEIAEGCLLVYSTSSENIQQCVEIVHGSVIENTIALKKASRPLVSSESWQDTVDKMHAQHAGKSHIKVSDDMNKVHVCATDDVAMDILDNLKRFLRLNTVTEEKVTCTKNCHRLIERHHTHELSNISKDLQTHHVQIVSTSGYGGFEIIGTEDGIQKAKSRLMALIQQVKQHEHTFQRPGIAEHMQTAKGKDNLNTIETALPCVVSIKGEDFEEENPYETLPAESGISNNIGLKGLKIIAHCKAYDCRNIYTAEGDMTELSAEMLVNPADDKLSLTGGLGKAFLKKGGIEIQRECKDYISVEGKLGDGEVFVSTAGSLKAENIAHVMGPIWRGGMKDEEKMLEEAVFKCLLQASTRNLKSVAVPAISCGTYGYPVRKATSTIVEAVKNFFREVQDSSVIDVYLCDMKLNTVEGFNEALQREFASTYQKYISQKPQPVPRRSRSSTYSSGEDSDNDFIPPMDTDEEEEIPYAGADTHGAAKVRGPPLPKGGRPLLQSDGSIKLGNIAVSVVKGEMARQKVDVMVNTTAKNLDLKNGAVSASLLKAAGPELQQEVAKKYPSGIKDGEIAVTSGQKLACDLIVHSSMMNWDGGNADTCKKALHHLMSECMSVAQSKNKSSIAFPAIGTGNLGFPRDVVATEMFAAVSKFTESNPTSSIQDVRFIVYQKDFSTIQAFEAEVKRWASGKPKGASGGGRQERKFNIYEDLQRGREGKTHENHDYENISECMGDENDDSDDDSDDGVDSDSGPYKLGSITVSVKQGDITLEDADCIVNSSNETLDLNQGAVSQQLLKKCGKPLKKEVEQLKKEMQTKHIVMTSAPKLNCKKIIHVVAKETTHEWKETVERCLCLAEKNHLRSIAFPALGTRLQLPAADMADTITKAIEEFQKTHPEYVKDVLLVIYQQKMVEDFHKAIRKVCKGIGKKRKGQYERLGAQKRPTDKRIQDPNTVTFLILALTEDTIKKAISKLESCLDKEIHSKCFDDSIIKQMDDNQLIELKAVANQHHLVLNLQKDTGHIEISGIAQNVMSASDKIHRMIRDAASLEQQKNVAVLMSNLVQWSYIEVDTTGQKVIPYDQDLNYKIETGYIAKSQNVKFSASDDTGMHTYIVDFSRMQEYQDGDDPDGSDTDVVTVIRRDLVKQGAFEQPALWTDMTGNLRVVTLQPTQQEYVDISQKFTTSAGSGFDVVKVERVQNKTLWAQYQAKKKLLEDQNPPNTKNEQLLWHGTAVEAVDNINAHGFNRSYCGKNATMYGDGVYFAVNAQYSCQKKYSRPDSAGVQRMYYCRVLTGEFCHGKQGMRVPPKKTGDSAGIALYDSVVNKTSNPDMYIIFHDTQAYPEYLVSFKAMK